MKYHVSKKEIRVGIVAADSKASWAKVSHGPPIQGLSGLMFAVVARRAAERGERQDVIRCKKQI
jgi:hypothetical protein